MRESLAMWRTPLCSALLSIALSSAARAPQAVPQDGATQQQPEVAAAIAKALAQKRGGDQDGALATLLQARQSAPNDAELLYDLGSQEEQMRLLADADATLTESLRLRPSEPRALYALARVKMAREDPATALDLFRQYLKQRPDDASARYGYGLALHRLLRDDEAVAQFERSLALQPAQTESNYQLGIIALSRDQLAEAQRRFSAVVGRASQHGGSLTGLGQVALREKRYGDARDLLKRAVAATPDYAEAHRYLAIALAKLGDAEGSRSEAAEAERLTAEQDRARKGMALK